MSVLPHRRPGSLVQHRQAFAIKMVGAIADPGGDLVPCGYVAGDRLCLRTRFASSPESFAWSVR